MKVFLEFLIYLLRFLEKKFRCENNYYKPSRLDNLLKLQQDLRNLFLCQEPSNCSNLFNRVLEHTQDLVHPRRNLDVSGLPHFGQP